MKCPTCGIEIKDHPAGACLDALFAKVVMGEWLKFFWKSEIPIIIGSGHHRPESPVPPYSTNISHAMEGVELLLKNPNMRFQMFSGQTDWYVATYPAFKDGTEATAPLDKLELAITRALILWAMGNKD